MNVVKIWLLEIMFSQRYAYISYVYLILNINIFLKFVFFVFLIHSPITFLPHNCLFITYFQPITK